MLCLKIMTLEFMAVTPFFTSWPVTLPISLQLQGSTSAKSYQWLDFQTFTILYPPVFRQEVMRQWFLAGNVVCVGSTRWYSLCAVLCHRLWHVQHSQLADNRSRWPVASGVRQYHKYTSYHSSWVCVGNSTMYISLILKLSDMTGLTFCH